MSMELLQILLRPDQALQRRASWARFNALLVVVPGPDQEALEALLDDRVDKLLPVE
jgi:hypothetical protein